MDPKGEAAMTKDQIERYGGICDKIVALRSLKVRDTVQGSSSEIPYCPLPAKIDRKKVKKTE